MAFNNGFPASYQPMGYGYPQYPQMQQTPMPGAQMSPANQQMMTPPTIRAEIVQVDGEEAAAAYPVGAGASQMMIAKDDSAIFVKTALANGQATLDVFVKRPPAPPKPTVDLGAYVTRDEMEERLAGILAGLTPKKKTKEAEG